MSPDYIKERQWLNYGAWHRAPNLRDRIEDYEWILYGDLDYAIRDVTKPIESIIAELDLANKVNVSVVLPMDIPGNGYVFSSYAVLVKNSPFGIRLLDNWIKVGKGLCPNGNFKNSGSRYRWEDSDQPGLWASLIMTHMEFFPRYDDPKFPVCDNETGLIDEMGNRAYLDEIAAYFKRRNATLGNHGDALSKVPSDQPILWSAFDGQNPLDSLPLGVDGKKPKGRGSIPYALGVHKMDFNHAAPHQQEYCKGHRGCYANYTESGQLQIGCNGVQYYPASTNNNNNNYAL